MIFKTFAHGITTFFQHANTDVVMSIRFIWVEVFIIFSISFPIKLTVDNAFCVFFSSSKSSLLLFFIGEH